MTTADNSLHFRFIKKKVLDFAGLKVVSASDCKMLSVLLSKKTNKYLSETTIKRIYGFAQAKFAVSAFTRDVLAEFCGFENWHNYILKFRISGNDSLLELSEQTILPHESSVLKSFLDTLKIRIFLLNAVYNDNDTIIDFIIEVANKEMEEVTGRKDLPGKLYTQEYPGTQKTGLYDLMLKVMETGEPDQLDYYYPYDGLDAWYSSRIIKTAHGLLTTHQSLTDSNAPKQHLEEVNLGFK